MDVQGSIDGSWVSAWEGGTDSAVENGVKDEEDDT